MYCRVKWLSVDVSEVRAASIIRDEWAQAHKINIVCHVIKTDLNGFSVPDRFPLYTATARFKMHLRPKFEVRDSHCTVTAEHVNVWRTVSADHEAPLAHFSPSFLLPPFKRMTEPSSAPSSHTLSGREAKFHTHTKQVKCYCLHFNLYDLIYYTAGLHNLKVHVTKL
jgi:hypothetical protein